MRRISKLGGAVRRLIGRYRRVVLLYHRIAEVDTDPWALRVTPRHFAEHLEVLQRLGSIARLGDMVDALGQKRLPDAMVAIAFDDGYADNLYEAKPLLERSGVPATFFLTTGRVGRDQEFWWDELERVLLRPGSLPETLDLPLAGGRFRWQLGDSATYREAAAERDRSWRAWRKPQGGRQALYRALWRALLPRPHGEQQAILDRLASWAGVAREVRPSHRALSDEEAVRLIDGRLLEAGAHTQTHPLLPGLPLDSQREELRESKARCEEIAGSRVRGFAYPFGRYTARSPALVREAGFDYACTTAPWSIGARTDPYRLPRVEVRDWDGEEFARRLFGHAPRA